MLRHGMGLVPRLTLRAALPSLHEVVLFAAGHSVLGTASGHGTLSIQISAPALHAGLYQLTIARLAGGPVCLIAPSLHHDPAIGTLTVTPGLWAVDMIYGAFSVWSGWLADGMPLADTGATLTLATQHAGKAIRHSESVAQGGLQTSALSGIFDVPEADPEPGEFALRATSDATFEVELANARPITIMITEPAERAGIHTLNPQALAAGPVCLTSPRLEGLAVAGQELRLVGGLWAHDLIATPITVARAWRRDGALLANVGTKLLLTAADLGRTITVLETAYDTNGTVIVATPPRHVPRPGTVPDTFSTAGEVSIKTYDGESGFCWLSTANPQNGATIANGRLRSAIGGGNFGPVIRDQDLPPDQFAEATILIGASNTTANTIGLAVRATAGVNTDFNGHMVRHANGKWQILTRFGATSSGYMDLGNATYATGDEITARLEVRGVADLRLIVNGEVFATHTAPYAISDGYAGILAVGSPAAGSANEINQFHAGALA